MRKNIFFATLFLIASLSHAETLVLFHPNGPTLSTIAERFAQAERHIDVAMYNMDATGTGPIVLWLRSPEVQKRIADRELQVRILLNGSPSDAKRAGKMTALEALGVDVRWLSNARELHHKFAVIDSGLSHPQVISGSANWSESSRTSYTENIFFVKDEPALATQFQNQFNFLWSISTEFGTVGPRQDVVNSTALEAPMISATFNVPDPSWLSVGGKTELSAADYLLASQFVEAIDQARHEIKIATTRFRLRSIYDAVVRAAARGVKVQIVLTQAEYWSPARRSKMTLPNCPSIHAKNCSLNTNYAVPLLSHEGIEVRVKEFSLRLTDAIQRQMHSKYLIVDSSVVISGSFNFSVASEFGNFENIVRFKAPGETSAITAYQSNFTDLWQLNRGEYPAFLQNLETLLKTKQKIPCHFGPMVLSFFEMDAILELSQAHKVVLNKECL